ncbi:5-(carboxyamino)imidazole ribonucleotide synthase [Corynebacterium sp. CCM 9187]|nr:5-(carboxyamino)imidazole ribonucleotide synthase [Corynebacterium pygosceleis]MCK7674873.1 5-(carboxyamino)imidazole ribonucleotide synthase [Corynebacterium pygosceleis]MCL0119538.1 5-(carboxyamino)imidazole ribonucleotide synthase [Corynebacterium pygosceleis]
MPVVTVIGDGQLARMMQTAAIEMGQSVRLLAGSAGASAAQVAADVIIGDYTDLDALRGAAEGASVVTFDHEHVPARHLRALMDAGVNVQPGPDALAHAQDKLIMRERLRQLGAPVPPFTAVDSVDDATTFFDDVDSRVCLKARRGGYDGKGVWFPGTREELIRLVTELLGRGVPLMAEEKVRLDRELSAMVARTPSGRCAAWPVVESVQTAGVCTEAVAPAPDLPPALGERAGELAVKIAGDLGVTGVLAVELFLVHADSGGEARILVNELAMRPHNTGHWTQDGSRTSQFEQHIRAVLDLPLGSPEPVGGTTVMANVLGADTDPDQSLHDRMIEVWNRFPDAKIHLYGKDWRPGRKIGHVNLTSDPGLGGGVPELRRRARLAAHYLVHATWADGWISD